MIDPERRKMLVRVLYENDIPSSILVHDLIAIKTQILFIKLTIAVNLDFIGK